MGKCKGGREAPLGDPRDRRGAPLLGGDQVRWLQVPWELGSYITKFTITLPNMVIKFGTCKRNLFITLKFNVRPAMSYLQGKMVQTLDKPSAFI